MTNRETDVKINSKELWSALLLLSVASIGLWINLDYPLGTARAMGPGFMPLLVLGLLFVLSIILLFTALASTTSPLANWTKADIATLVAGSAAAALSFLALGEITIFIGSWHAFGIALCIGLGILALSPGWRKLALVLTGMAVFAIILPQGGFILALCALLIVAAFAEPEHRPLPVLVYILFMLALCWWIFIYELDIRVNVWPFL
jgi:hypothetical protein